MGDARLEAVIIALVKSVGQVLADYKVTEHELYPALGFLAELIRDGELELLATALGLTSIVDDNTHQAEQQGGTASNIRGPYYLGARPGSPTARAWSTRTSPAKSCGFGAPWRTSKAAPCRARCWTFGTATPAGSTHSMPARGPTTCGGA